MRTTPIMSTPNETGLIRLDLSAMLPTPFLKFFEKPIKSLSKISVFEMYLNQVDKDKSSDSYWVKWLRHLQIHCKPIRSDEKAVISTGPVIYLSNEPFGLLTTIALAAVISQARSDVKILASSYLQPFFGLTDDLIGIEYFKPGVSNYQHVLFTELFNWLDDGGALIVSPGDPLAKSFLDKLPLTSPAEKIFVYFQDSPKEIPQRLTALQSIRTCLKMRGETIYYSH